MPYGGLDLDKMIRYRKYGDDPKVARMVKIFIKNLRRNVKHLILGLILMHKNRIVHRDIKQGNVLVDIVDKGEGKIGMALRYADFGLSEFLTASYTSKMENIHLRGTAMYYSPELIAVSTINKNLQETDMAYLKNKFYINSDDEKIKKLMQKTLRDDKLYNNYIAKRGAIFNTIKREFDNGSILPMFFGTDANRFNGYLQKGDVYALGALIYETLMDHKSLNNPQFEIDTQLKDLLNKMLEMDPKLRYNAIQALNHPFLYKI
jgi:serine/threonine protein kinase